MEFTPGVPGVGSSAMVGDNGSSRQSCKETEPVVSEPAKAEIEGDDVAAQALKHLTEKKTA